MSPTSTPSHIKCITAILIVSLHIAIAIPAKNIARPVIEVINEQARIDEKVRPPGFLPYGNPLAGNSKQNARLHAQNQQAMFNAERVRQHRAQLQRWTKAPQQEDSYMKAYHESQENHQLALEKQQADNERKQQIREAKAVTAAPKLRQIQVKRGPKPKQPDVEKITKADAIIRTDRVRSREDFKTGIRNHRSYGSADYRQYLQPKKYQTVYVSPGPTYDQGVTIKPNGNVGLAALKHAQMQEDNKLYTAAIPSKTQYVYPKQYHQMQSYQSAYDIDTLNSLLKKNPTDQLSELNALLGKQNSETEKDPLNTPIDLYFYLKDTPEALPQHYDQTKYAQVAPNYASAYTHENKDHTPITEEVDDIEDPNNHRPKTYQLQVVTPTQAPEEHIETTTTKSNNYYKVEVASQTISAPYKSKPSYYYKGEEKPEYLTSYYNQPYQSYVKDPKLEGDLSERYLHHNAEHKGIQHLSEDGSGVSAYGNDDLHYAANYEFGYRVKDYHSGNDFGHHEAKSGGNTNGHYHVLLPDGRMQKVKYSAGPEGFHADISYDHLH
ncbi:uncharacterized protein LOC126378092 isoform X2 [Pectinophora gossypiella]|nr:uncharacterized protein LOC126378092 isoform X2 [Pectinophora gossypiella]XP_049882215.1 uncharacterized protein LOC126378092 isoform X2 [Pectinophora gossypiella]